MKFAEVVNHQQVQLIESVTVQTAKAQGCLRVVEVWACRTRAGSMETRRSSLPLAIVVSVFAHALLCLAIGFSAGFHTTESAASIGKGMTVLLSASGNEPMSPPSALVPIQREYRTIDRLAAPRAADGVGVFTQHDVPTLDSAGASSLSLVALVAVSAPALQSGNEVIRPLPLAATRQGVRGTVSLTFDYNGVPVDVKVESSSGNTLLDLDAQAWGESAVREHWPPFDSKQPARVTIHYTD